MKIGAAYVVGAPGLLEELAVQLAAEFSLLD
jgi:hypothetical protein